LAQAICLQSYLSAWCSILRNVKARAILDFSSFLFAIDTQPIQNEGLCEFEGEGQCKRKHKA
jgi:hypothetical protein